MLERGWSVGNGSRQYGMVASCSKPWKVEAIFEMWKEPCIDGPGCLGDPSASGMTGTIAVAAWLTEESVEREIWRALATPLSISSQLGHCRVCSHGTVLGMIGWDRVAAGMEDDVAAGMESRKYAPMSDWFCLTGGTKVLSWIVAGVVFMSLISSVADLEPGMTDCLHVGELILRPQTNDDLNYFLERECCILDCGD